jgi:hypothetical protein
MKAKIKKRHKPKIGETMIYYWPGDKERKYPYKKIYSLNHKKFIFEHYIVAEKIMGRPLKKNDVVHHINKNTLDNRPENLRIYKSALEHKKAHGRAVLEEDYIFKEDNIKFLEEIFGVNNSLYFWDEKEPSKWGKKLNISPHKYIDELYEDIDLTPSIEDKGHTINCLTYSPYFKNRVINELKEFFLKLMIING